MKTKVFLLLFSAVSFAQVGINTTTPNAQLDISSSNQATPANTDGLLIPKVDAFCAVNPTAAQQGMQVYLTTADATHPIGFYYWDNPTTSWIGFSTNTNTGWLTTGNAGTNPTVNFLGTTDNKDLVFKRNNIKAGLLQDYDGVTNLLGNTAFGVHSLENNTTGSVNTANGVGALFSNTTGDGNIANGHQALYSNTTGGGNIANGYQALYANTTGFGNIASGHQALYANTTGFGNIASGFQALNSNTTGNGNVANGFQALYAAKTNNDIVAIGDNALSNNSTTPFAGPQYDYITGTYTLNSGDHNTAVGSFALTTNDQGVSNTATGYKSLFNNISGNYNTANGAGALYNNTFGIENTANGTNALHDNTLGSENTANGAGALLGNTLGNENTANGAAALKNNTLGDDNTAIGLRALTYNTIGNGNTANGAGALESNTQGGFNTANGSNALFDNTTGNYNTAIGDDALFFNITGNYNTADGYQVGYNLASNLINTTCLGYYAGFGSTGSNQINIGNNAITWIGGQVGWSTYSDKRIKNNIQENVPGLAFISKLKPVTYNLDIRKEYEIANLGKKDTSADYEGKYDIEKIKMTGFLAQEVEQAAKDCNYDFSGVTAPKEGKGLYSLRYSDFVMPLVKAVQELNKKMEDQQTTIENQNKTIQQLAERLKALEENRK